MIPVPLVHPEVWPTCRLSERLTIFVLCPSQGGEEPASLPATQAAAGGVSVGRAGAHTGAHPGLRQEGTTALQTPSPTISRIMGLTSNNGIHS